MEFLLPHSSRSHPPRPGAIPSLSMLRRLCLLEASTLLALLLVAVPLKHLAGLPIAVSVMGPVHGMAFLVFCWQLAQARTERAVDGATTWRLLLAAFIPLGGFYSWFMLGREAAR
jgi:integral membrane protein